MSPAPLEPRNAVGVPADRPESTPNPASTTTAAPPAGFDCVLCGSPMYGVHCKLHCPNCGYREDCSDLFRADAADTLPPPA